MKRLTIVADRTSMVEAFRLVLRQTTGFQLVTVLDGRTRIPDRIRDILPDVVLVDDMQDRQAVVLRIKELSEATPMSQIIFLASAMNSETTADALDAGAHAIISKSVHPVGLATLLRETANGNIIHRPNGLATQAAGESDPCLTSRELEILRLAAEGQTNDQIARALWVTQKTVKFHLSNTYRKLGVSNRTEASHYAHRNDLLRERQRIAC